MSKRLLSSDTASIMKLALPATVSQISFTLVQLVDSIFIGRLGPEYLSAVSLSSVILWNVFTLGDGFAIGITATISRMVGEKNLKAAAVFFRTGLITIAGTGLILCPILLLNYNTIFALIRMPKEIFPISGEYFATFSAFMPLVFCLITLQAAFRASGDTLTPMLVGLVTNLINVFLDWALIAGNFGFPALGIRGAALASGISFSVGTLFLFSLALFKKWGLRASGRLFSLSHLKRIVRVAVPSTAEMLAMSISQLLVMSVAVNPLGSLNIAVFHIVMRLSSLSFMPGFGFAQASAALTGQRLGARDPEGANRLLWLSTLFCTLVMLGITILYFALPDQLAGMFTQDREVIRLTRLPLRIYTFCAAFLGPAMVLGGGLRGAGDTRFPMRVMFLSRFLIRVPVCRLLGVTLNLGIAGVWGGMCLDFVLRGLLLAMRTLQGKWKSIKV